MTLHRILTLHDGLLSTHSSIHNISCLLLWLAKPQQCILYSRTQLPLIRGILLLLRIISVHRHRHCLHRTIRQLQSFYLQMTLITMESNYIHTHTHMMTSVLDYVNGRTLWWYVINQPANDAIILLIKNLYENDICDRMSNKLLWCNTNSDSDYMY